MYTHTYCTIVYIMFSYSQPSFLGIYNKNNNGLGVKHSLLNSPTFFDFVLTTVDKDRYYNSWN